MSLAIWLALLGCVLGCYFGAAHIALKTFSRKRLADLLEDRGRLSRLEWLLTRLPKLLLLTGTVRACASLLVLLAVLLYIDQQFASVLEQWQRYAAAFVVAGALVSVFAVAIPVSWARYHRERLVAASIPLLRGLLVVLMPMATVLYLVDPVIRRVSGADLSQSDDHPLSDQVLSVVEEHEHEIGTPVDETQKEMLEAVFDLPNTAAGEIMTPRTDVKGIEVHSSLDEVKRRVIEYGHSRIPVYDDSLDHIIGILYAKDLISLVGNGNGENEAFDLRAVLREAFMVPESKSVRELLAEFKGRKVHLAVVLDEYGGTAGLVTIEDILEELVGEIQDEYEPVEEGPNIDRIDERTAEVDARVRVDDLNDALDVELPEDEDYDTVGGFVFAQLGHIPEVGEVFEYDGMRFTVLEAERTKVRRVRVERLEEPSPAEATQEPAPNGT